jgi:predicted transcriptional regulator
VSDSLRSVETGSYKEKVLLALLDGPKRFKEIARTANIHDALVDRALTEFMKKGWIIKTSEGLYSLTEDGVRVANMVSKEARLYSLFVKAKASDPDSLEAVLELHLQLKELDRRVSLKNMHDAAFLLFSIGIGPEYILPLGKYKRLREIVLILHEYLKKIFRDISHELENEAIYLLTSITGEKDNAKSKAREQIVKLRFARELLKSVKLEALTEDERKLALEIQDILNSFVPTKEYLKQLEEEEKEQKTK